LQTVMLLRLIEAYPDYISKLRDKKTTVYQLRHKLGKGLIVSDRDGYRFRPEAVL